MSGIVGLVHLNEKPVSARAVAAMLAAMPHRGPDASGRWIEREIGLGHLLLCTTPESLREKQPLRDPVAGLTLTADVRLDNREELFSALGVERPPAVVTDPDLILQAYKKWGEDCPRRLIGDFAFALWDAPRRQLFCARSPFGVKPLFYHYSPRRLFVFASEIKSILRLPEVPRCVNELAIADFLQGQFGDTNLTFYQDIYRLEPACSLCVGRDRFEIRSFWSLDPSRELRLQDRREYADAFRDVFTRAVRARLRSAYPLGSTLSGGLDSSAVVCMADKLLSHDGGPLLHTFSAVFDRYPECDEREYIRAVEAHTGGKSHYFSTESTSPLADIEQELRNQDGPFAFPGMIIFRHASSLAHYRGVRIMLDGGGGDQTIALGYWRLADLVLSGSWLALLPELVHLTGSKMRRLRRHLLRLVFDALAPAPAREALHNFRGYKDPQIQVHPLISKGFARRLGYQEILLERKANEEKISDLGNRHYAELIACWPQHHLDSLEMGMAAESMESWHPFADQRLVEFCLALPTERKYARGLTRATMRDGLRGILPPRVRLRLGKARLCFAESMHLLEKSQIQKKLLDTPSPHDYMEEGYVQDVADAFLHKQALGKWSDVYRAIVLVTWLEQLQMKPLVGGTASYEGT